MVTVEEADKIIARHVPAFPSVKMPLAEAFGMVLREDFTADRDLPPFNRVAMDGIGIDFGAWEQGVRAFPVEGTQKAGSPQMSLKDSRACLEVMTGAVLPAGCDCVIPVEAIETDGVQARVRDGTTPVRLQNVHAQGADYAAGTRLVAQGARLLAPQVAVAASVGKSEVLVARPPKVAVIGTGDELVGIDEKVEPHQIRQSNSYAVMAILQLNGYAQAARFHLRDDKEEMTSRLKKILDEFDAVILSGGVSMGKYDYVPEVLNALGVEVLFHKVKQRPGKPFWFGQSKGGQPVFALPGNPVSTQIGARRYVLPCLDRAAGATESNEFAVLAKAVDVKTELTCFLPVRVLSGADGRRTAEPVVPNGSGDYASLAQTDGFVELAAGTGTFPQGTVARLFRWKF